MATKKADRTDIKVNSNKLAYGTTTFYRWMDTYVNVAKAISEDAGFVEFLQTAEIIKPKVVTKIVEKEVVPDLADPRVIAPDEAEMLGETIKLLEHRLHDETKRDYSENGGANWRANHDKAQTFLNLRQKLKLPDHTFAVECCVPQVEELDLQALATTAHGIDARDPSPKS